MKGFPQGLPKTAFAASSKGLSEAVPFIMTGLGVAILSTSQGVISDREARKLNVGGELLCEVW